MPRLIWVFTGRTAILSCRGSYSPERDPHPKIMHPTLAGAQQNLQNDQCVQRRLGITVGSLKFHRAPGEDRSDCADAHADLNLSRPFSSKVFNWTCNSHLTELASSKHFNIRSLDWFFLLQLFGWGYTPSFLLYDWVVDIKPQHSPTLSPH